MNKWPGEFRLVDPRVLQIDARYQRPEKWDLISRIAAAPSWEKFGCLYCFDRDDGLYVYDGQQRMNGVLSSEKPPREVPVIVMPETHLADEADAFVGVVVNRKGLTVIEKHRALIVAGDPQAIAVDRVVGAAGFTIGASSNPRTIGAIGSLYWIYEHLGEDGVAAVLWIIHEAWDDDRQGTSTLILRVVAEVLIDSNRGTEGVAKALSRTTPHKILQRADGFLFDMGGSKRVNVRRAVQELCRI